MEIDSDIKEISARLVEERLTNLYVIDTYPLSSERQTIQVEYRFLYTMMKQVLSVSVLLLYCVVAFAQEHAFPVDKGLGEPGPKARSFVIGWHPVPGVAGYEYVLTDNFLCFAGCAGDTRNEIIQDTFTIEYELLIDRQYYWVTRVHFENGETGPWSLISEFWAWTPPVEPILQVAPNPVVGPFQVRLDWGANPDADLLSVTILNTEGRIMSSPREIRTNSLLRKDTQIWEDIDLSPGVYILLIEARSNDGRSFKPLVSKIQVKE